MQNYFLVNGVKIHWDFKLLPKRFEAITLFGHVFDTRSKEDLYYFLNTKSGIIMANHERIHMLQAETFKTKYLGFYLFYIWYWIVNLFKFGIKDDLAYFNIPFELEAYFNQRDLFYKESKWKTYK